MTRVLATCGVVAVIVIAFRLAAAASPCVEKGPPTTKRNGPPHGMEEPINTPDPCQKTNQQAETRSGETVEWDPVGCWDCPQPGEPAAFFLMGLFLAAPICLWVIRRSTRKVESQGVKS